VTVASERENVVQAPRKSMMQRSMSGPSRILSLGMTALVNVVPTAAAASSGLPAPDAGHALQLHVASPEWRDQIIYFAMIDRFDDGDASNNDQGAGEYDPRDPKRYSGGDLAGITRRLDYIRDLGATAVWITPPVAHQWWDGVVDYGGYHGYWAESFAEVDAHFGTLDDYRRLSDQLHRRGMYLVQDVVVNHVGNYFTYGRDWRAADPRHGLRMNPDSRPRAAPTQWPFTLNDARRPDHRRADIYHWTPRIEDFADARQEQTWALADLDDLNTDNPTVRRALRASYGRWIRDVGVDAFRVDTAFYVEPDYFRDFLDADDAAAPGVLRVARATGRGAFHVFGEGFGIDRPHEAIQAQRIDRYQRDSEGRTLLPGMINFPLYGSTLDVFARGLAPAVLAHRIGSMMQHHAQPHLMPSFVDNHDVERFLAAGSDAALAQSLLLILTLPGIPVIYYGTEQGFTGQRDAMFAAGFGSGGRDRFDPQAPLYRYLQRAIALRRAHPVLSRGVPQVLAANAASPGALAYSMRLANDVALVVFNSADRESLVANLATGLAPGTRLVPRFSIDGDAPALVVGADGALTLRLAARSGQVWFADGKEQANPSAPAAPSIDALPDEAVVGDLALSGTAPGGQPVMLVVDGDLSSAARVTPDASGRWRARLDTASLVDPRTAHEVVAWYEATGATSGPRRFKVERRWRESARVDDPAGDDRGRSGTLVYPTDRDWRAHRPLDLRQVTMATSGGSLRIDVRMHELISRWNAPHGFDHLALTLFIELPARDDGERRMPLQNASLPGGMRWHYRLRVGGWSNTLFAADGAGATSEGRAITPVAALGVDLDADTLRLTLPAASLGRPANLAGARVYLATWDYDGGYRPLAPEAQTHTFGGGDGAHEPLLMDESEIIVLR
jgi:glycosidase